MYQDLIDENDNVIGKATRKEVKEKALLHRAVFVFVFNSKGELYLQKRSANMTVFPLLWGISASGGVDAGEDYEGAAVRELSEELGITGVELKYIFDYKYNSDETNYIGKAYTCVYDGEIVLQQEEIETGAFKSMKEIKAMADEGIICPDDIDIIEKYNETK